MHCASESNPRILFPERELRFWVSMAYYGTILAYLLI